MTRNTRRKWIGSVALLATLSIPFAIRARSTPKPPAESEASHCRDVGGAVNHHHWVTESGDTVFFADADATAFPTSVQGLLAVSYTNGINVTGGTGRFAGATGQLATVFGAVNLGQGQIVLRYQGQVCFASQDNP